MGEILLPRPDNVRGRFGSYVTSDVFHIAERLQEVDKRLFIQSLDPPITQFGRTYNFAIVENTPVGEQLVMRVQELDARIITSVERMLHIPFSKRFEAAERECERWEAEQQEKALDELYERMGGNMRIQLERCGFTDPWGPKYAPMNKVARRHRRNRAFSGLMGVGA
jgi:hypothetical protein